MNEKIKKLMDEVRALKATAATEKRDLTAEEAKAINEKLDEVDGCEAVLKVENRVAETEQRQTAPVAGPLSGKPDPGITVGADREALKPFRTFGEQLRAIFKAGPQQANSENCDKRLRALNEAWEKEERAAGTGNYEAIGAEGGFLVQQDFATDLTSLADDDSNNVLLSRCTQRTISSAANSLRINGLDETSRVNGSRGGGVRVYTTAELDQMTESRPKFNKIELKLDMLTGLYYASDEELADVAFLEGEVTDLFQREFGFKTQDLIFRGSGAGEPLGILNADCTISIAKETGQAASTITAENIGKMWARMPASLRGQAIWIGNQDVEAQLDQLHIVVGTGGVPVYMPAGGISDAPTGRLKGRSVFFIEQAETLGTVGDLSLVSMSPYIWATKGGIQAASSIHLKFDFNQTAFRWTFRCDGQPRYKSALTPYKGTAKVSPFVTLATRA